MSDRVQKALADFDYILAQVDYSGWVFLQYAVADNAIKSQSRFFRRDAQISGTTVVQEIRNKAQAQRIKRFLPQSGMSTDVENRDTIFDFESADDAVQFKLLMS